MSETEPIALDASRSLLPAAPNSEVILFAVGEVIFPRIFESFDDGISAKMIDAAAASAKDKKWILLTLERANSEKGNRGGFSAFRVEFARKYFPEIFSKKNSKKKPTLMEELREICA